MSGTVIGLKDLYYAKMSEDGSSGVSYGVPARIPGAIRAGYNPNSSAEALYADDGPMDTATALGLIELELEVARLSLAIMADLLGHSVVGGVLTRKAGDTPPWVAIGFRTLKSNGKYRYVWLLKGKFRQPENEAETKADRVTFKTPTIVGSFVRRDYDEAWIRETDEDEVGYVPATGASWFNSVELDVNTDAPEIISSTPADAANEVAVSTTYTWNFAEAIDEATMLADNFFLIKDTDGTNVAGTLAINAAKTSVTFTPGANLSAETVYRAISTKGVKSLYGIAMESNVIRKFTTA